MTNSLIEKIRKEFENMQTIYIADGHHRSASSYLLIRRFKSRKPRSYKEMNLIIFL